MTDLPFQPQHLVTPVERDATAVMGRRILAWLVDAVLFMAVAIGAFAVFAEYVEVPPSIGSSACDILQADNPDAAGSCFVVNDRAYITSDDETVAQTLISVGYLAFFIVLQGLTGGSPGKLLTGLRVVSPDGTRAGVGKSLVRTVLWIVDAAPWIVPLVGFIVGLTSTGHRRVGDMAAKTYVIGARDQGTPVLAPHAAPPDSQPWGSEPPAWQAPPPSTATTDISSAPPTAEPEPEPFEPMTWDTTPTEPATLEPVTAEPVAPEPEPFEPMTWDTTPSEPTPSDPVTPEPVAPVVDETETGPESWSSGGETSGIEPAPDVELDPDWWKTPEQTSSPEATADPFPGAEPALEPEPTPEPEPATEAVPTTGPDPASEAEPAPESEPAPEAEPEPEPERTSDPTPTAEAEVDPEPEPTAEPQPSTQDTSASSSAPFVAPGGEPEAETPTETPKETSEVPPPQWDEARNTYIQWDPARRLWLQWDADANRWKLIDT